jgi:hypothetical protein
MDISAKDDDDDDEYQDNEYDDDPQLEEEILLDWTDEWDDLAEEIDNAAQKGEDTSTLVVASLRPRYTSANNPTIFQDIITRAEQLATQSIVATPPAIDSEPSPTPSLPSYSPHSSHQPLSASPRPKITRLESFEESSPEPSKLPGSFARSPQTSDEDEVLPISLRRELSQHPDQDFLSRYPIYKVRCLVR